MKKIFLWLSLSIALPSGLWAQPGFYFNNVAACEGDTFCVDVTVDNFSNIVSTSYQVLFDPEVIQFVNMQMPSLPGFSDSNIDASAAASGILSINWEVGACSSPGVTGVTLNDCFGQCRPSIFKLCFVMVSNTYGQNTNIDVGPNPYVTKDNSACLNVGLLNNSGLISNCVRPVTLIASQEQGNVGDLVCVDFLVAGFDDLNSMQFTINYDPTVLSFQNVVIPGNIPNFTQAGSMGVPPAVQDGKITVSWLFINPENTGITLLDSTLMFQACFRIIGPCESSSMITFGEDPTPIEFGNTIVQNFNVTVLKSSGLVRTADCDPSGVPMRVVCGPARSLGETFCVDITSNNFTNIAAFNYLVEWNPSILQFESIQSVTTNGISNFSLANFSTSNVQNGILGVAWTRTGVNNAFIPNGTVHYRVCFQVIGVGGNSPIQIGNGNPSVQAGNLNAPNIGINPTNCEVTINQPSGVTLTVEDGEAALNEQVCIEIDASNFQSITRFRFSVNWDPLHLQFSSVQNLTLPGVIPLLNFNQQGVASGSLSFDWTTATPVSRPDGTALFRLCFTVIGPPGSCEEVIINDDPLAREAVTSFSNGTNVGIAVQPGNICSLFPEGFFLQIGSANTFWRDTVCLPFTVANFDNITEAHFDVGFNPVDLQFVGVQNLANLPGLSASSFNGSNAGIGIVEFDWNTLNGQMLPDSAILFEMCFAAIGEAGGACHNVEIIRTPAPVVLTSAGVGSMVWDDGGICVADKLIIREVIINPVSCPDAANGQIQLVVEGGQPPYGNTWFSNPQQFTPLLGRNLPVGQVIVVTRDNNVPATIRVDTFFVPLADDVPIADAGIDRPFPCDGSPLIPIQAQASQGPDFQYKWTTLGGQLAQPDTNTIGLALRQGIYIFSVTNRNTDCTVRDTVNILNPVFPVADAGPDQFTTCNSDTVRLDGSLSSTDDVTYSWTALNDGQVLSGEEGSAIPRVIGTGQYVLEVRFNNTSCTSVDTVLVQAPIQPNAFAGADPVLGCNATVVLDGSDSFSANPLNYIWRNSDGEVVSNDSLYETSTPGIYVLEVVDQVNSCSSTDTISVNSSPDLLTVNGGPNQTITCNVPEVTLSATVSNSTLYSINWTAVTGGNIVSGTENTLNARVTAPGTYRVFIQDLFNLCTAEDIVEVTAMNSPPPLQLNVPQRITCNQPTVQVTASTISGSVIVRRWYFNGQLLPATGASITASQEGFYRIEVENTMTGCIAVDSVEVRTDFNAPTVSIVQPPIFTCQFDTLNLFGNVVTGNVPGISFLWTTDGNPASIIGATARNPVVIAPGNYTFRATNPFTGCSGETTITVMADTTLPPIIPGDDLVIGCTGDSVLLQGFVDGNTNPLGFTWFTNDGTVISTTDSVRVTETGDYRLFVIDQVNGCFVWDTVNVSRSLEVPQVVIEPDTLRLDCRDDILTIPGQIIFDDPFAFQWDILDDGALEPGTETSLTPLTLTQGTYVLIGINPVNQCEAYDTVHVIVDRLLPQAVAGPDFTLTCVNTTYLLNSIGSDQGDNFSYRWLLNSNVISNLDTFTINQTGTYVLEVTNAVNGCVANDTVNISLDASPPLITLLDQSIEYFITCDNPTVTANLAYSPNNPEFDIAWNVTSPTGNILDLSADSLSITVDEPGTYTISVTNPFNGCVGTNEVVVELDTEVPTVALNGSPGLILDCATSIINLNGNGSSTGADYIYQWNVISGGQLTTITPLQVTTDTPGTYELLVRDITNGCESSRQIVVTEDRIAPNISLSNPPTLTCLLTSTSLSGVGSSSGPNFTTTWNALDGGTTVSTPNPLVVTVNSGGRYELVIRNTVNQCETRDTVTVIADIEPPVANAGPNQNVNCTGAPAVLDGSASTPFADLGFNWSNEAGGPLPGGNTPSVTVNAPGSYRLIVIDNTNGCRDTALVQVIIVNTLPDAMAGEPMQICDGDITLGAMLPSGVTGRWTSLGAAIVADADSPDSPVSNGQPGDNRFVWTLSSSDCPNYSADTVTINLQRPPIAGNDLLSIPTGSFNGNLNLLANDLLFGAPGVSVSVTSAPNLGMVDSIVNGVLHYSVLPGVFGQTQLRYAVCNANCPTLCDTAFVQIQVERTDIVFDVPNAITPNGDGLNDQLIFDQLLLRPDFYPDNELIIFNRWNDIVFKARPYLNNWEGTNQSGEPLPQGTYYYILRLNIAEGEILKGDITVVR